MQEQRNEDFYLDACQALVEKFSDLLGQKTALIKARKAPMQISPEGEIVDFYGEGEQVLNVLISQYEEVFGSAVARKEAKTALQSVADEDDQEYLPESLQPDLTGERASLLKRLWRWIES